jgi:lipid-A-disaccharide synthase
MTSYFLFAGEASGDLHGSHLMQSLRADKGSISLSGVGGPRMRKEGLDCFLQMENFQVMGCSDVLISLPRLWKLFYQVRDQILNTQPDCVILIDYPGFNLRLARSLRKSGFKGKLVQYVCPTVWAHGKQRIETLVSYYDLLLTIFPFEVAYFAHTPLKVRYIGNPLTETIRNYAYDHDWRAQIGLPMSKDLIALFPGSRRGEINRHVPQQIQAAAQLKRIYPDLCFAISCAQDTLQNDVLNKIRRESLCLNDDLYFVPARYNYELMKDCKTALAKSGTIALELALHFVPTVVHYELTLLNYFFAKFILHLQLPHYCIVNILRNQLIFPELMGRNIQSAALKRQLELLHFDSIKRQQIIEECKALKQGLEARSAHQSAAEEIWELMKC